MRRTSIKKRFIQYNIAAAFFPIVMSIVTLVGFYHIKTTEGADLDKYFTWYIYFIIGIFVVYSITDTLVIKSMDKISGPAKKLANSATLMADGKSVDPYIPKVNDEIMDLAMAINRLIEYSNDKVRVLSAVAEGDYTQQVAMLGSEDRLSIIIDKMVNSNSSLIREIKESAEHISLGSSNIASGANSLASGSTEQAVAVEEFSASLADVKSLAEQNVEISEETLLEVKKTTEIMDKNISDITNMTAAMEEITNSSRRIETVIKVIDDIAFQTNILALNAAVEAARAGQHGRGFAIVADEVRELASKSASAARETSELIQSSIQKVKEGNAIVEKINSSITELEQSAAKNSESMDMLLASSQTQKASIVEINKGISQIKGVIAENSAMAEESSAASQVMADQARKLKTIVERFKV